VEGVVSSSIDAVGTQECWEKVATICKFLANPSEAISIVCEIWPDTGRIIWIQKDRREFNRVELTIPELERKYFNISATTNFEYDYDVLLSQIKSAVKDGAAHVDLGFAHLVVVRDSDDPTTEELMK